MAAAVKKAKEEKYTVLLPKAGKEEDTHQYVSVNGKNYRIKKGVPVKVPKEVARVINQKISAEMEQDAFEDSHSASAE